MTQSSSAISPRRGLIAAAAAALIVGCISVAPPPPPQPPAPDAWFAGGADAAEEIADAWWTRFEQPELDRLIAEVLASNHDLRAAAGRIDEAAALARIAGAGLEPQISAGLDGGRSRRNFIGFPIPGSDSQVLSTTTTSLGSSLNVAWEIDLWGRLSARRKAATAGLEAGLAEYGAARLSLAGQTAKAWFALIEAARQVDLAEETASSRQLTSRQIQRRFAAGLRSGIDLRLALVNEAAAEAALEVRRRRLDTARRQIELLASSYPGAQARPDTEGMVLPVPPPGPPAGLPAELVTRRPDLAALERRLAAAGLGIAEARASLYPQLRLTGSAGRVSQEVEDLLDDDFSVWNLAANLLQPLFQGGRLRAGIELSEARYRQLAEGYAQAVLRAFAEVESALVADGFLHRQAAALETASHQAQAAQSQAEERYAVGLSPYLAVLEAQREATASRSRLLELERQILDNRIDLLLALGGDWVRRETE